MLTKKVTEIFTDFYETTKIVKGLKGYGILENIETNRETIGLIFWEQKEDMKKYFNR
jgi:heme-degrading monooxygenase HmoA